jgi:hypothetical protein
LAKKKIARRPIASFADETRFVARHFKPFPKFRMAG